MIIGIDIRSLQEGRRSGVEEYTLNLLKHLFRIDSKNQYKLFCNALAEINFKDFDFQKYANVKIYRFRFPNKILNLSFKAFRFPKIDKMLSGCDLFFAPNIFFGALSATCPLVLTFHDLSFKIFPYFYSTKRQLWHKFIQTKRLVQLACKIIAVSNSTKEDLQERFGLPQEKIEVIYSGVEKRFRKLELSSLDQIEAIRKKYNLPRKFVLYLGTLEPRKNIIGLIQAFELFKKRNKKFEDLKLVIAGPSGWLYKKIYAYATASVFSKDIIFSGFIENKDKVYLYNLASCFVYPSFYEGFGFPVLEAMACGLPVITSFVSSFPEVCQDAAILVDPYNISDISYALEKVLTDEALRDQLIKEGIKQIQNLSWEKCAKKTLEIFYSVNSNRRFQ